MFILGTVLVGQAVFDQVLPRGDSTGGLHFARRELQDAGSGEAVANSTSSSSSAGGSATANEASDDDPRVVVVRIIASGTQADFGTAEESAIRVLFAEKAQVALDAVTVTIVAASVLITVSIDAINAAAAAAVETALEDVLTDADATTAFLQQAVPGIVVESADMKEELATSEGIDPAIIAVAAVGGVLAIGVVVAVGYYVFRKRKNVETITSTRAKADVEAQAVGFSAIPPGPKFDPHTGAAITAPAPGPKFDPHTGAAITAPASGPKFDPHTGAAIPEPAPSGPVNVASNLAKLKDLKELLDAGVITQEEFDAQKMLILSH